MLTKESADIICNMPRYISIHRPRVSKEPKGSHPYKAWGPSKVKLPEPIAILPGYIQLRGRSPQLENQTREILIDMKNEEMSGRFPKRPQRITVFPKTVDTHKRHKYLRKNSGLKGCGGTPIYVQQYQQKGTQQAHFGKDYADAIFQRKELEQKMERLYVEHNHLPFILSPQSHEIHKEQIEASMDLVENDIELFRKFIDTYH